MPDRRDAESAWKQALKGKPSFLVLTCTYQQEGHYQQKGRPKKEAPPDSAVWHVKSSFSVDPHEVEMQIKKQASFILATNVLDEEKLSNSQVYLTYKDQGGVERGCAFSQRSALSGFFRFRQEARAGDGPQFHHGSLLVSLSFS